MKATDKGPLKVRIENKGTYADPGGLPQAWAYRSESGAIEIHAQVKDGKDMTHYIFTVRAPRS